MKKAHLPVLLGAVVESVQPLAQLNGFFIDGTFGRGGHSRALLEKYQNLKLIGLDCDHEAVEFAEKNFAEFSGRFEIQRKNFSDFDSALGGRPLAGVLLDLGVSSPQLDQGQRGFSFYHNGPLDMRMDQTQTLTAAHVVNSYSAEELEKIFRELGEIYNSTKVVDRIIERRKTQEFSTTADLAEFIAAITGWRDKGYHPATNHFMALRIYVNDELGRLEKVLPQMISRLEKNGRILVITFHSLEDRIVKEAFRLFEERGEGLRVNKNVIQADFAEKKENPRSRSAKLRIFEKGAVKALSEKKKRKERDDYIKPKRTTT